MKNLILIIFSIFLFQCCSEVKPEPPIERVGIVRDLILQSSTYTIIFESNAHGLESFSYCSSCNSAPPLWKDLKCKITLSEKSGWTQAYQKIKVIRSE